ncbi:AarF/ABC1/UbiB kinase family protein [Streptomyces sp. Wb2n-11]|uniref:ABC1 kinase family protein n=1 Tax=Streptomyces sp. Wb2n-11 TaxID=1030533 RepID=UPI0021005540|nr:AarF/UbiB family protein [Streptomyces sp. Wb2n-11]
MFGQLAAEELSRALRNNRPGKKGSLDEQAQQKSERAQSVRRAFEQLGPFYIKVGQILSTRPDVVPDYVIPELEKLHDSAAVLPFSELQPVLRAELGANWARELRDIDTQQPLGAASLAQVYRATLADGRPAVVKIQRPGVRETVCQDMSILRRTARVTGRLAPRFTAVIDVEAMLDVLFDAMRPELDFTAEARNMRRAAQLTSSFKHLAVPEVFLATPRVLVQSLAPGQSIRHADHDAFSTDERLGIGEDLLAFVFRGFFIDRFFHADLHPGNVFVAPGEKATLIDWGMVGRTDRRTGMLLMLILLALAQNDGHCLAKAWVELGHATPWAQGGAFASDMAVLVPQIADASLEELNFGLTLTRILTCSTKRGIRTSPTVAVLGKAFANVEGSVRYLAPELSLIEVFKEEMQHVMLALAAETVSKEQIARTALELMLGIGAVAEQVRGLVGNQQFTFRTGD